MLNTIGIQQKGFFHSIFLLSKDLNETDHYYQLFLRLLDVDACFSCKCDRFIVSLLQLVNASP